MNHQDRKTVVTGASGQLGTELCRQLGPRAVPLSRAQLDLTDAKAVKDCLVSCKPSAVINAAAYTQVDRAETEPDACRQVNASAVETLAAVCRNLDCPLMQVSTDYVFGKDAQRQTPYTEYDAPGPLNVYGESKLLAEGAAQAWEKHFVIRTCGLYSTSSEGAVRGRNFADTMLSLAWEGKTTLRVVDDQYCTPSYAPHVARLMIELLASRDYGIYHVTNQGQATWFQFASELFRMADISMSLVPITTSEYAAPARRPSYSVLNTSKVNKCCRSVLPQWQDGLRDYLGSLAAAARTG